MRRYLITLVPVVFLGWQQPPLPEGEKGGRQPAGVSSDDIKPTEAQHKAEGIAVSMLSSLHYRKVALNDSLSSEMFDRYISSIDRGKLYLLASDVKEYEQYRFSFDDFIRGNQLDVPFRMYNRFRQRYKERSEYIQRLLSEKAPFDFSIDETLNSDRESAPWAADTTELNDVWRKYLKNEALDIRLAGKADTAVVSLLRDRYKNRDRALARIRSEQVFQMYMNAYAESLDPHTSYMAPSTADRFKQDMSQSLEGIGAVLQEDGNYIRIKDIIPGGPAYKSKFFNKEDRIIGVAQGDDGRIVDIVGWFVEDAVKLIKGPKGTVVRLQILPADALVGSPPKEYRVVREKIKIEEKRARKEVVTQTVSGKTVKIGVIEIPMFYRDFEGAAQREQEFSSTTRDVQKLIDELKAEKVEGIVIDLRNNGGGSLIEAISLTGIFINSGPVVQVKEGSGEIEVHSDTDSFIGYSGPLAVMINRFSASASEIFAAAIQDYRRGVIVGENSFGKGTVQTLIDLARYSRSGPSEQLGDLKMTVAKFYRVTGSSTQLRGVAPDLEFPTAFKKNEYMEASERSALPWDKIATSRFESTKMVDDKLMARLKSNHNERLGTVDELKKFVADVETFKKARENKVVSLLESKRRQEQLEAEKKSAALKQLEESEMEDEDSTQDRKNKKDVYLNETARVVVDMITLGKGNSLADRKKKQ